MPARKGTNESREITDRFISCIYALIGYRKIKSKSEFCEVVGLTPQGLYRMEKEITLLAPLFAIRNAHLKFGVSLEFIFTGKGDMFD